MDQAEQEVEVQVDGTHYTKTDNQGRFKIQYVKVGKHLVKLNLLTVRADLTSLEGLEKIVQLPPGKDLAVNFRLIRSGGFSGRLWLDENQNGKRGV